MLRRDDKISKLRFGEWSALSYLKKTIVTVRPNTKTDIRLMYESRVHWLGDISSSAKVQLCNVTKADEKKYGVEIDIQGKTTMKNGVQLNVIGKVLEI